MGKETAMKQAAESRPSQCTEVNFGCLGCLFVLVIAVVLVGVLRRAWFWAFAGIGAVI